MLEIDLRKNTTNFSIIWRVRDVNRNIKYQCHGVKDNRCSDVITEFLWLLLHRLFICVCTLFFEVFIFAAEHSHNLWVNQTRI